MYFIDIDNRKYVGLSFPSIHIRKEEIIILYMIHLYAHDYY